MDGKADLCKVELALFFVHAFYALELLEEFASWAVLKAEAHPIFGFEYAEQFAEEGVCIGCLC